MGLLHQGHKNMRLQESKCARLMEFSIRELDLPYRFFRNTQLKYYATPLKALYFRFLSSSYESYHLQQFLFHQLSALNHRRLSDKIHSRLIHLLIIFPAEAWQNYLCEVLQKIL